MGGKVVLGNWSYEDVELDVRAYAFKVRAEYRDDKPLAFLPEGCAAVAVEKIGTSRGELAELSGYSYATAAGWVSQARRLSRGVAAGALFPALCEAYVRRCEPQGGKALAIACGIYLAGGELDEALRLSTERHVAALLCTGELSTAEEREREKAERTRDYYRSLLRFAASYLEGDELADAAHSGGGVISKHMQLPTKQEEPDELMLCIEDMRWALWLDREDQLAHLGLEDGEFDLLGFGDDGAELDAATVVRNGTALIGDTAERKRLLDMDGPEFDFARMLIDYCGLERARAVEFDSSRPHPAA